MKKEQAEKLIELMGDSGNVSATIQEDYSGRGMYGKTTTAVILNEESKPVNLATVLSEIFNGMEEQDSEEIIALGIWKLNIDNMGRGYVLY